MSEEVAPPKKKRVLKSHEKNKKHRIKNYRPKVDPVRQDHELTKRVFMQSDYVEWSPFAESMKWNPNATRLKYPVAEWVREKKRILAETQSERISDLLFKHRPEWHNQVLKHLKDAPALAESVENIIKYRINQMVGLINQDMEAQRQAAAQGKPFDPSRESKFWRQVGNGSLMSLSQAVKGIIEAKQRSLMLGNWSVTNAEEFSNPKTIEDQTFAGQAWNLKIIHHDGNLKHTDVKDFMEQYLDKLPYAKPSEEAKLQTTPDPAVLLPEPSEED